MSDTNKREIILIGRSLKKAFFTRAHAFKASITSENEIPDDH